MKKQQLYLLKQSTLNEVRQKYAGSAIGLVWAFLFPFFLFSIYIVMYMFIFRIKPVDLTSSQYVIYILSGLIPFLSFSEALTMGTSSIVAKKDLLLNTIYPSQLIPVQSVLAGHANIVSGIIILILLNLLLTHSFPPTYFLIPVMVVLQILFVIGLVWFLSILNLIFRDIQQILALVIMILMIISPIAYTRHMVPGSLKLLIWLNPFSFYVISYQDIFVYQNVSGIFIGTIFLSLVVFISGFYFFNRVKSIFYDYV